MTTNALDELLAKYEIAQPPCLSDLPEGWVGIVDDLIADLIELGWDKDLQQIKEKFAGLRFYIGGGEYDNETWEAISNRIRQAEQESLKTCGVCGSDEGRTVGRDYYTTLCPQHAKE